MRHKYHLAGLVSTGLIVVSTQWATSADTSPGNRAAEADDVRTALAESAQDVLNWMPTDDGIKSIENLAQREVVAHFSNLTELALQSETMTDEEFAYLAGELSSFAVILGSGAITDCDSGSGPMELTQADCHEDCSAYRRDCIVADCGPGTSWPCFCCAQCNFGAAACHIGCVVHDPD